MQIDSLDTPALLIDLDIMEQNLRRVAEYTKQHGLRLRPHTKTHKIPALARRQLDCGAVGLTVAKTAEAEVMLTAEPADVLVAYPVVGRQKLVRLAEIAKKTAVTVALDSVVAASQLSEAASAAGVRFGVLAETDVGLHRVGVHPERLVEFIKSIAVLAGLSFEGIAFFPGHIRQVEAESKQAFEAVARLVASILVDLREAGFEARIVSGGNTPSLFHSHLINDLNEIRPGTYIFNDRNTVFSNACTLEDCAVSVLVTVVSTAVDGQMIVDGGSKTFSSDPYWGPEVSFGYLKEAPRAVFRRMNEEHGFIDIRQTARRFRVGDRVRIVPNHVCPAVNLHEFAYGVVGERVEHVWAIEGRGKLQ